MISNDSQRTREKQHYLNLHQNESCVVNSDSNSSKFQFEQETLDYLASDDYEKKSIFCIKLAKALMLNTAHPFYTSDTIIYHIIDHLPDSFYFSPLLTLLQTILFVREEEFGLELSSRLFEVIFYIISTFREQENDFTPVFTIIGYLLQENSEIIKAKSEYVIFFSELLQEKLSSSNKKPSEISAIASILLSFCAQSSELDEEMINLLANDLTLLIKSHHDLLPTGIAQTINCAYHFIFNKATNEMLKETGFFHTVLEEINFLESDIILNDTLNYFSQVLHYSYCEDDESDEEVNYDQEVETGLEEFDEFVIISKLISLDSKETNLMISCLLFLIKIFPIKQDSIEKWATSGIVQFFLSKYENLNYLVRSFFLDLFICLINAADIDLLLAFLETGIMKPILILFSVEEDQEKIAILKMIFKVIVQLNENKSPKLPDFIEEIAPIIEESTDSTNPKIEEIANVLDDAINPSS